MGKIIALFKASHRKAFGSRPALARTHLWHANWLTRGNPFKGIQRQSFHLCRIHYAPPLCRDGRAFECFQFEICLYLIKYCTYTLIVSLRIRLCCLPITLMWNIISDIDQKHSKRKSISDFDPFHLSAFFSVPFWNHRLIFKVHFLCNQLLYN